MAQAGIGLRTGAQASPHDRFLGLVSGGWLTSARLDDAARCARLSHRDLEAILLEREQIPEDALRACLSEFYHCPAFSSSLAAEIQPELLRALSLEYLRGHGWMPLRQVQQTIDVITDDPHDLARLQDIRQAFPRAMLRYLVALRRDIRRLLGVVTGAGAGEGQEAPTSALLQEALREHRAEQPEGDSSSSVDVTHNAIVRLANQIITEAHRLGASDIHVEPSLSHKDTVIRLRIDGTCVPHMTIPALCRRALISRFKIMASLDIAERRKPQDGKIRFPVTAQEIIEVRVATIPTGGCDEDVVLRLLTGKGPLPLEAMDLPHPLSSALTNLAQKPYGIILCVGPTGSGKTTTLHALLQRINTLERKIWTAEDPIEITQEGLRQVQVHPKIGFTFAAALRAFLRADPDVIMIGEMRDRETADVALEASLTGHLVLSTLHTNSAVETVTRLLDLGCDPYNFADALLGILAKRLCKRLCPDCKEPYRPSRAEYDGLVAAYRAEHWSRLGYADGEAWRVYRPTGCAACKGTGFKGRLALYELLLGSDELRGLIQAKAQSSALLTCAVTAGMTTLVQDGIQKVLAGETTAAEVQRVAIK